MGVGAGERWPPPAPLQMHARAAGHAQTALVCTLPQLLATYTSFPHYFGVAIDSAGLLERLDGGHTLISRATLMMLTRGAPNIKTKARFLFCRAALHSMRLPENGVVTHTRTANPACAAHCSTDTPAAHCRQRKADTSEPPRASVSEKPFLQKEKKEKKKKKEKEKENKKAKCTPQAGCSWRDARMLTRIH